jgi:zinc/manganese transport system substrate-binding protein
MTKKGVIVALALVVIILASVIFAVSLLSNQSRTAQPNQSFETSQSSHVALIQVVAAEDFWGSLISQLGGSRTQVLSIVTDPNATFQAWMNGELISLQNALTASQEK